MGAVLCCVGAFAPRLWGASTRGLSAAAASFSAAPIGRRASQLPRVCFCPRSRSPVGQSLPALGSTSPSPCCSSQSLSPSPGAAGPFCGGRRPASNHGAPPAAYARFGRRWSIASRGHCSDARGVYCTGAASFSLCPRLRAACGKLRAPCILVDRRQGDHCALPLALCPLPTAPSPRCTPCSQQRRC